MKNAKRDEFGYLSTRGVSKYWGVSKQQTPTVGPDPWVVKYADSFIPVGASNRYRLFTAQDFSLTEKDAAIIAAYFYENRKPFDQYPANLFFQNGKRWFKVNTRSRKIEVKFSPYETGEIVKLVGVTAPVVSTSMLDDIKATDVAEVIIESNEDVSYNNGFAAGFALREIIERRLGEKGLKEILVAVQARLNKGE